MVWFVVTLFVFWIVWMIVTNGEGLLHTIKIKMLDRRIEHWLDEQQMCAIRACVLFREDKGVANLFSMISYHIGSYGPWVLDCEEYVQI